MNKSFYSTAEGQKEMSHRASRIAVLLRLNGAIRKMNPAEAYHDDFLANTADSQIDSMRDSLTADYNRLSKAKESQ